MGSSKQIVPCMLALLTSACSVMEEYKLPDMSELLPKSWTQADKKIVTPVPSQEIRVSELPVREWWKSLKDPVLDELIDKALSNNYDLKIAEARIAEAQALRGQTVSKLFPTIDATGSATRLGQQESLGGSNRTNNEWSIGANANWVVDLFGQTAEQVKAAEAATERAQANYRGTKLALISEVARTYVEMRALQQRKILTERNLKFEEETLRITKIQYETQAVSQLDLVRARAQVETTRAGLPTIEALLAASYHRLAVLKGEAPGANKLLQKAGPVPVFTEKVMLDVPIATVGARPDVQVAEAALREAAALKNSASAEVFPKLTLSGFFGSGGATLYSASNPWSLGANALLPLLNFGRIESQIDAADARKQQALNNYKQTVLKALEEVENALVSYGREIQRAKSLDIAVRDTRQAANLARIKYQAGDTTFLDVLIVEERLLSIESDSIISHASVAKAAITLHTALGMNAEAAPTPPL